MELGLTKDKESVIRLKEKEWHNDYTKEIFKESSGLIFWGAIKYNWKGPCVIIQPETETVRN